MANRLFLFLILSTGFSINAQTTDCTVNKASISGFYTGECKKGLAHGMGIAQGTDRYEGHFYVKICLLAMFSLISNTFLIFVK